LGRTQFGLELAAGTNYKFAVSDGIGNSNTWNSKRHNKGFEFQAFKI